MTNGPPTGGPSPGRPRGSASASAPAGYSQAAAAPKSPKGFGDRESEGRKTARGIKERFGSEKALGYLLGEKLLDFLRASDRHPALAVELPAFVAEVKTVFEPWEIREYLSGVRRLGPLAHTMGEEEFEEFRAAGAVEEDVVLAAEDAILVERMKLLLLAGR